MKSIPKVTVVTVTYNAEEFLEETIKSVIEQDYPNLEYIIIDGSSTDGTLDIIKKYEASITKWISQPDDGIYYAMNKGIDLATGEWINFMNAGDSFASNTTISAVIANLGKDTDIIAGDIYYLKDEKKEYRQAKGLKFKFDGMFFCHQTMFTKTCLLKKYKFNTTYRVVADYELALRLAISNYKYQFLDFAIANYLSGGFYESNSLYSRIENLYIQARYLENPSNIFKSNNYKILKSKDTTNNNYTFSVIYNKLLTWLDSLDKTKKYALYGYGNIGKLIIEKSNKNITVIFDNQAKEKNINSSAFTLTNPDEINNHCFDYLIITVLGREKDIINNLKNLNFDTSKALIIEL